MNFEEALEIAARHRALNRAGTEQYDRLEGSAKQPFTNPQQAEANQQRFEQLASQAQQKSMAEQQQQQFQEQQQKAALEQQSQGEIRQINKVIKSIQDNPALTEQEKSDLIHSQELKKMELEPEMPDDRPPWPRWQDPGMKWIEEKRGAGVKADGSPWLVTLTRANRGDVQVLHDEKEEYDKFMLESRKLDIEQRKADIEDRKVDAMMAANEAKQEAENAKAERERFKRDDDIASSEEDRSVAAAERRAAKAASQRANDERNQWQQSQSGKEKADPQPNWNQVFEQYKAEELQNEMESSAPSGSSQMAMDAAGSGIIDPATGEGVVLNNETGAYEVPM